MKVLHVITSLNTGGAERALLNLLAGGLAKNTKSVVLSLQDEGSIGPQIKALGVPVYTLRMRRGIPGLKAVARLFQVVRGFQPDIIQGWMYHGNIAASLAGCFVPKDTKISWNVRQSLYDLQAEKPLTRKVIKSARLLSGRVPSIIYNSNLSRCHHESFGFDDKHSKVIPNGFDLDYLAPCLKECQAIREEFGIKENTIIVGHVARFDPMKDHASFLKAAVHVSRQINDIKFLVVGREVSPNNSALRGIVPAELLDRFVFTGERRDVYKIMKAIDVFCLSSWSEAFPNVLGEAMAAGVPCVTTDVGDSKEIVGNTGVVVPPFDSVSLAEGLLSVIRMSGDRRRELGGAARERVKERYSLEKIVQQYQKLYEELIRRQV